MYHKRSLISYLYILKLSLWLLLGCSIVGNKLCANSNKKDMPSYVRKLRKKSEEGISRKIRIANYAATFFTVLGVFAILSAPYKIYKRYFAKEKKEDTISVPEAPASPRKNWLLFILCLLLGVLLVIGIFYRKKKRA